MLTALGRRTPLILRSASSSTPLRLVLVPNQGVRRVEAAFKQNDRLPEAPAPTQAPMSSSALEAAAPAAGSSPRGDMAVAAPPSFRRFGDTLAQVQREMDAMMNHFLGEDMLWQPVNPRLGFGALAAPPSPDGQGFGGAMVPFDVQETDKAYVISADVPGFSKDHVKCTLSPEGVLTIQGQQKEEENTATRRSSRFSSFTRSFRLPNDVRTDGISASVKHGVLTVEVPKATKAEIPVREIPVAE